MLDIIRANAQSWGVKIAFGIIIVVFVFWGVGGLTGSPSTVALTVNDRPVTVQEFQRRLALIEENLRSRYPDLDREQLKQLRLRQQAVQQLVLDAVLEQEAERAGIRVSPFELRQRIESYPFFRNSEGVFDPDLYLRLLEARRDTPGRFEAELRRELLLEKLQRDVTAGAAVSESEVRALFNYDGARLPLHYVLFPLSDFTDRAAPTPEAVKAYYDAHQAAFRVPAKADADYFLVGASTLAPLFTPDEAAVQRFYEQNKARFTRPARIKARHILIGLAANAPEAERAKAEAEAADLEKRLAAGEDFAALAAEHSQDPGSAAQGGDLGWFGKGVMTPAFEDAAFALQKGELSKPVRSEFGYHLIRVDDVQPETVQPLAEAAEAIRQQLGAEEAAGKLQDTLDHILLAVLSGKSMAEAGAPYKLEPIGTGLQDAEELAATMGVTSDDVQTLFAAQPGTAVNTPFVTKDGYVVAALKTKQPETMRPFEEVRAEIEERLRTERSRELAVEAATAALTNMKDGKLPPELAAREQQSEPLSRRGNQGLLGGNPALAQAAFNADPGQWLPVAYALDDGAVLVRTGEIILPEDAVWQEVKEPLLEAVRNAKREQLFRTFVNMLMAKADVQIRNEQLLEE